MKWTTLWFGNYNFKYLIKICILLLLLLLLLSHFSGVRLCAIP